MFGKRMFLLVLLLVPLVLPAEPKHLVEPEYAEGEVLVRYRDAVSTEAQQARIHALGLRTIRMVHAPTARNDRPILHLQSDTRSTQELVEALRADPAVEFVEPNYRFTRQAVTPNDPRFPELWGLTRIGAPEAWETSTGSDEVVVAVIDSGVNYLHEDLADNMWRTPGAAACTGLEGDEVQWLEAGTFGYDFAADDAGNDDPDPMDIDGHGTHVAGTIAAVGDNAIGVVGVNWNTRIVAVKAERPDGFFYASDQVQALRYVRVLREKCGINVVAVNASYGGRNPGSTAVREQIEALSGVGIIFVAAAGNNTEENDTTPFHPANTDLPNVISVASTAPNDRLSGFSNYGLNKVHLAAPGSAILSTTMSWEGTGLVTHGTDDFPATVFTFSASADEGITRSLHHCGLALQASDCPAAVAGNIALIERGEANFSVKVENAKQAGAVAAIIYNSVAGGEDPINGTLGSPGDWLPTFGVARSVGLALLDLGTPTVTVRTIGGYSLKSGTSMAAPHVTGALALLAAVHPSDSMTMRIERLLAAVEPLPALQETTRSGGLLNLRTAFTHPSDQPPLRPGNARAVHTGPDSVTLNWENRSAGTTGFVVERRTDGGAWTEVGTPSVVTTALVQSAINPARLYEWRVRAIGAGGASTWSNTARSIKQVQTGEAVLDSVSPGQWHVYRIRADQDRVRLRVRLDELAADADLYVRRDSPPTLENRDCRPFLAGNAAETCLLGNTSDTDWYIGIRGFEPTGYRVRAILAPRAPAPFTVTAIEGRRAVLSWSDDSGDADSFRIERRMVSGGGFSAVATVPGDTMGWTDEDLVHGTEYVYRVFAVNDADDSAPSSEVTITAFDGAMAAPAAPSGLSAVPVAPNTILLRWNDDADNESGYRIKRRPAAGSDFEVLEEIAAGSEEFTDTGLPAGSYVYRIFAFNSVGDSAPGEISAAAYDALGVLDDGGAVTESLTATAGSPAYFSVSGGSGQIAVSVSPNQQTGVLASVSEGGSGWSFLVPSTGAFAGTYLVSVTDLVTGWTESVEVDVPLLVELSTTQVLSAAEELSAVVRGAPSGVTPTYVFNRSITSSTHFTAEVLEATMTQDDPGSGNPASMRVRLSDAFRQSVTVFAQVGQVSGTSEQVDLVPSCRNIGRTVDVLGNPIAGVLIIVPGFPWELVSDATGQFDGYLPWFSNRWLQYSHPGYRTRESASACNSPRDIPMELEDYRLRVILGPMFPDEEAFVTLFQRIGGEESRFGEFWHRATAEGTGEAMIEFGLDSRLEYPRITVATGWEGSPEGGYLFIDDTRDGAGWSSAQGADIQQRFEMVPTSPYFEHVDSLPPTSQNVARLSSRGNGNWRATRAWFEWGLHPDHLSRTTDELTTSSIGYFEMIFGVSGLSCGTTIHYRGVAENDWGIRVQESVKQATTVACPQQAQPPPQGGGGGGRVGPLTVLVWAALGWIAFRRRARPACA